MLSLPGKPFFASPSSLPWGFTLLYQRPHIYTYCFLAKCTLCFLNNGKFLKRKRLLRPLGDDFTSLKIIMSKWAAGLRILQTLSKTSIQMFVIPQKILGFSQFTMLITLSRFQTVPLASRNLPKQVSSSAFKGEETGSERPKVCPDVTASEVPTELRGKN